MEPGHEDQEYVLAQKPQGGTVRPQWSPVMKTGNTRSGFTVLGRGTVPQWSPVMKTGNTFRAMLSSSLGMQPQWSPVMKTGNTSRPRSLRSPFPRLNGARS